MKILDLFRRITAVPAPEKKPTPKPPAPAEPSFMDLYRQAWQRYWGSAPVTAQNVQAVEDARLREQRRRGQRLLAEDMSRNGGVYFPESDAHGSIPWGDEP